MKNEINPSRALKEDNENVKPSAVYALVLNGTYVWTLNWKNRELAKSSGVVQESAEAIIVGKEKFSRVGIIMPESAIGGASMFVTFPGGVVGSFNSPQEVLEVKAREAGLLLIGEPKMVHQNNINMIEYGSAALSGFSRKKSPNLNEKKVNWYVYNSAVELLEISSKRESDGVFLRRTHIGQLCEQNQEFEFLKKLIKTKS